MNDMIRIVEPLIPALRRYARSLLKDRAAADDLVQDCLERTITRWHQRRPDGDARTWVFTILHNLAIAEFRKTARRGPHVALDDVQEAALVSEPDQFHRVQHVDLVSALDMLPEEQRAVILLVSVEDLSYAEVAEVLDIPIGTVMSRLSRGRERLQRLMDGEVGRSVSAPKLRSVK
ncbi:MAG: RNA polymerase sigma factor [Janthinobacterium lividum]